LRYIFDHYLTHAFGMLPDEHVHFANVTTGMPKLWADRHLYQVEEQARQTCAALLDDWRKQKTSLVGGTAPETA
jgi:NAD(P)H dehydrogenase (quinone)